MAEIDDAARVAVARGFGDWEARIRDGLRAMHARGDLGRVDPDDLALATLAAVQGGLLLTQVQRDTRPLEVALDAMIDHIQACRGGLAERLIAFATTSRPGWPGGEVLCIAPECAGADESVTTFAEAAGLVTLMGAELMMVEVR